MRRRALALLLLALLLLAAAVALLAVAGRRAGEDAGGALDPEATAESAPPDVDALDVPRRDPSPARRPSDSEPAAADAPRATRDVGPRSATPPDPLERGPCSLLLRAVDGETGEPVATAVDLWRLGAPENEHWTAGAQLQAEVELGEDGAWIRELPAGRYRARCHAERPAAEDPPLFQVSGEETEHVLRVALPREREVRLRLHRADGSLVRRAEFHFTSTGASMRDVPRPEWAEDREPLFESTGPQIGYGMGGSWSGSRRTRFTELAADADGWFVVGDAEGGDRGTTPRYRIDARADGLAPVEHGFSGDAAELRFVSVLVDPAEIAESVRAPDGRPVTALDPGPRVRAGAVPHDPIAVRPWRDVPIRVWRKYAGDYADLEFTCTLEDLPLPTRVLEEVPAEDG